MKFLATDFYKFLNKAFSKKWFKLSVLVLFLFRLCYGLSYKFFTTDEIQVFLIGLKNYTTGIWPYFGSDVVHTASRIPGSLQAFVISIPLKIWNSPESPVIFLNLLSLFSLVFFGKYLVRRIKKVPAGFIWLWLFTCPWTLNYSTHIINPSYLYIVSIPFFVALIELWVFPKETFYRKRFLLFIMGAALMVAAQFHMSAILLLGFFFLLWFVFVGKTNSQNGVLSLIPFAFGLAAPVVFLVPTFLEFSDIFFGGTENNVDFNLARIKDSIWVWVRSIGFASTEVNEWLSRGPRFLEYLGKHPLQWLLAVPLALASAAQIIFVSWRIVKPKVDPLFSKIRPIYWVGVVMIAGSFLFSIKGPIGFSFMIIFPLMFVITLLAIQPLFTKRKIRIVISSVVLLNLLFHGVYAFHSFHDESMYINKHDILLALEKKEHTFVGQRRVADFEQDLLHPIWTKDSLRKSWQGVKYNASFDNQDLRFWHEQVSKNQSLTAPYSNPIHKNMTDGIFHSMGLEDGSFSSVNVKLNYFRTSQHGFHMKVQLRTEHTIDYDSVYTLPLDTALAQWHSLEQQLTGLPAIPDSTYRLFVFACRDEGPGDEVIYLDEMEYIFRR